MQSLGVTKIKKLNPRQGYLAPYIQLPWGYREDLIGDQAEIFEVDGGFFIKIGHEEFKQRGNISVENRVVSLESNVKTIIDILFQNKLNIKSEIINQTGLKGFEPLTYGLRVRRSTELSYKPRSDFITWYTDGHKTFGFAGFSSGNP